VGKVLFDEQHQPQSLLFCSRDITARKKTEQALEAGERKYRDLAENVPAMISTFLPDSTLLFVNRWYSRYFNAEASALTGRRFLDFIPEGAEREEARRTYMSLTPEKPQVTYEHRAVDGQGNIRWQEWTDLAFFNSDGSFDHFLSIGQDVTQRRQAAEELQRQLDEKTLLLKESHHRIKNNLASVEGLLSIQASGVESAEARSALNEALGRCVMCACFMNICFCLMISAGWLCVRTSMPCLKTLSACIRKWRDCICIQKSPKSNWAPKQCFRWG
jgi:PAS domain S-box-containing protein